MINKENNKEVWKAIPSFSRYQASNYGLIRSINYKNSNKTKIIKPSLSGGYLKTMLQSDSGKYKSWTIHNFIAITFLGTKPSGYEINHKNGIKTDNRVDNLEYCTRSENCQHSFDIGIQRPKRGSLNGRAKLSDSDVLEIRSYVKSKIDKGIRYYGRKQLAKKYGVSESHIKDIISKRRGVWNHL